MHARNPTTSYLKAGAIGEELMSVSFPPVEVELTCKFVAWGPEVKTFSVTVVFVETPFVVL